MSFLEKLERMLQKTLLVEKSWSSHAGNVQAARETVREVLHSRQERLEIDLIELAVGEACANAVEHGSPRGVQNEFVLRCFAADRTELIFEVEDEGVGFSLTRLKLSALPNLESEGGRGLFLINQIMDQVAIRRTARGLSLQMTKLLSTL
jgi:anti-sigma regulatory factor (Ser/Thr protein kinase)